MIDSQYVQGANSVTLQAVYTPPGNVTFVLLKTGVSENITEMRVGTRISFKLQIIFPQNSTDMLVELFAPDNETMVMMLCNVVVQPAGASLSFTGTGTPVLDSANGSTTLVSHYSSLLLSLSLSFLM